MKNYSKQNFCTFVCKMCQQAGAGTGVSCTRTSALACGGCTVVHCTALSHLHIRELPIGGLRGYYNRQPKPSSLSQTSHSALCQAYGVTEQDLVNTDPSCPLCDEKCPQDLEHRARCPALARLRCTTYGFTILDYILSLVRHMLTRLSQEVLLLVTNLLMILDWTY